MQSTVFWSKDLNVTLIIVQIVLANQRTYGSVPLSVWASLAVKIKSQTKIFMYIVKSVNYNLFIICLKCKFVFFCQINYFVNYFAFTVISAAFQRQVEMVYRYNQTIKYSVRQQFAFTSQLVTVVIIYL